MRALVTSNYTYADRAGNIFYLWNAALPLLPHPPGGDARDAGRARCASCGRATSRSRRCRSSGIRRGGYVHNENDSPHFANVRGRVNLVNAYPNIEPPTLRLRSQHAIAADRRQPQVQPRGRRPAEAQLPDAAGRSREAGSDRGGAGDEADRRRRRGAGAAAAVEQHGRARRAGARRCSRSGASATRRAGRAPAVFAHAVDARPIRCATPRGLADPARAAEAFAWAVEETARRHGRWDVAWGDVHRVRRGDGRRAGRRMFGRDGLLPRARLRARPGRQARREHRRRLGARGRVRRRRRARTRCSPTARARTRRRRGTPTRPRCSRAAR